MAAKAVNVPYMLLHMYICILGNASYAIFVPGSQYMNYKSRKASIRNRSLEKHVHNTPKSLSLNTPVLLLLYMKKDISFTLLLQFIHPHVMTLQLMCHNGHHKGTNLKVGNHAMEF